MSLLSSSLFQSSISIIFHSIPVHNFASRDLQLIPVLQEIEYIPRTRTYCLELKICETKTQFSIYTYSNLLSVCYIPRVEAKERECWKFLDWRLNSENESRVHGQPSIGVFFLLLSVVIYCLSVRTISSHDHRQAWKT
eukprot:UN2546